MKLGTRTLLIRWLAGIWCVALGTAGIAQQAPTGRVILEISGAITNVNGDGVMRYDRDMLEALGMHEIITETPWTDGSVTFRGVLARDLMASAGATGTQIKAIALNDYSVEIPVPDFETYGVILALQKDGEYLTVRNRGPLWIIYPWTDETELQNELYYSRSIWQLRTIDVRPN